MCSTADAPEAKTTTTNNSGLQQHATNLSATAPPPQPPTPSPPPPPDTLPTSIGFSSADLRTAVDVITKLQGTPAAFLENDALCASGIWRVINRKKSLVPRHEWKRSVLRLRKAGQKEERRSARAASRGADAAAVAATGSVAARTTARKRAARAFALERPSPQALMLQSTAAAAETDAADAADEEEASAPELHHQRRCHICRAPYRVLHAFYHALCPACAALNYAKRQQRRDMSGAAVLVTGVRIKIGHQVALRLLRDGAVVVGTTRFPADAARRFAAEPDYAAFRDRLRLHALDLRDLAAVKAFCAYLAADDAAAAAATPPLPPLVAVVHNAAQTIARPEAYYARLRVGEAAALEEDVARTIAPGWGGCAAAALPPPAAAPAAAAAAAASSSALALAAETALADVGVATRLHEEGFAVVVGDGGAARAVRAAPFYDMHDSFSEACDARSKTTWWTKLQDVSAEEAAAVHAVNCLAPFIMNSLLRPVLERGAAGGAKRFVVNVSAMEGQFYRAKTPYHPHTNMAKAAMNMMTRTAGPEFAEAGIYMTSVDTGWVTDMAPRPHQRESFTPPLDEVDGAARILDPIYTDSSMHTVLIKDYKPTDW